MTQARDCEQCGKHMPASFGPESNMGWCSDACLAAWEEADPKRKEGWISVSDLTPERLREVFNASGLDVANSAGPVVNS